MYSQCILIIFGVVGLMDVLTVDSTDSIADSDFQLDAMVMSEHASDIDLHENVTVNRRQKRYDYDDNGDQGGSGDGSIDIDSGNTAEYYETTTAYSPGYYTNGAYGDADQEASGDFSGGTGGAYGDADQETSGDSSGDDTDGAYGDDIQETSSSSYGYSDQESTRTTLSANIPVVAHSATKKGDGNSSRQIHASFGYVVMTVVCLLVLAGP